MFQEVLLSICFTAFFPQQVTDESMFWFEIRKGGRRAVQSKQGKAKKIDLFGAD